MAFVLSRRSPHARPFHKTSLDVVETLVRAFSVLTKTERENLRDHMRRGTGLLFGRDHQVFRRRGKG